MRKRALSVPRVWQVMRVSGMHMQLFFPEDGEQYWFSKRKVQEWLRSFPQPAHQPNAVPPQPIKKSRKESAAPPAAPKPIAAPRPAAPPPPKKVSAPGGKAKIADGSYGYGAAPRLPNPASTQPAAVAAYVDSDDDFDIEIEEFSSAQELHEAVAARAAGYSQPPHTAASPANAAPLSAPPPSLPPSAPPFEEPSPSLGLPAASRGRGRAGGGALGATAGAVGLPALGSVEYNALMKRLAEQQEEECQICGRKDNDHLMVRMSRGERCA